MLNVHYGVGLEDSVITVTVVFPDSTDPSNTEKGFEVTRFQIPIPGWLAINKMVESMIADENSTSASDNILKMALGDMFDEKNNTAP